MKIGDINKDNFEIRILPNTEDDFEHLTLVNGLYVKEGGSPVDYVLSKIINPLRDKLKKKFKNIKPGDIKNKLKLYINIRFFPNLQFNSQTKERVTNHLKEFDDFFKDKIDWDKVINKLLKDKELISLITEYYTLKEKAKEKAELKKLEKTQKKIKSDKFYPAIKLNKYLFITEGESANGAIQPVLGREYNAYYELKGVPLNAWEISTQKLSSNKELSELWR